MQVERIEAGIHSLAVGASVGHGSGSGAGSSGPPANGVDVGVGVEVGVGLSVGVGAGVGGALGASVGVRVGTSVGVSAGADGRIGDGAIGDGAGDRLFATADEEGVGVSVASAIFPPRLEPGVGDALGWPIRFTPRTAPPSTRAATTATPTIARPARPVVQGVPGDGVWTPDGGVQGVAGAGSGDPLWGPKA